MLVVTQEIKKALCFHAQSEYPNECCGALLGIREGEKRLVWKVVPTENVSGAKQSSGRFVIDPLVLADIERSAEREQMEVVGFYHSHPDCEAIASAEDTLYMIAGYSYPILSVHDGVCTRIACFEKSGQEDVEAKEEKIMMQGET